MTNGKEERRKKANKAFTKFESVLLLNFFNDIFFKKLLIVLEGCSCALGHCLLGR